MDPTFPESRSEIRSDSLSRVELEMALSDVRAAFRVVWILILAVPSPAGATNHYPSLVPLTDRYPIPAATRERLEIQASDRDGDPLRFRLLRGPSFVNVRTIDPGHGVARGEIDIAPDSCGRGEARCVIEVSDGKDTDVDSLLLEVHPLKRRLLPNPMTPSSERLTLFAEPHTTEAAAAIVGEWEWHMTEGGKGLAITPENRRYRKRAVFHPDGRVDLFEIGTDQVVHTTHATYQWNRGSNRMMVSRWFPDFGMGDHLSLATELDRRFLVVYPTDFTDAPSDWFVRASEVVSSTTTQARLQWTQGRQQVVLPPAWNQAIRTRYPDFRIWTEADDHELGHGLEHSPHGANAIAGDFDGDMLPDVALLGRSGADQVVLAVLSHHGVPLAVEVAWRKVWIGSGAYRTRADPERIVPVSLQLAPRMQFNPFCWVSRSAITPRDGVGIVVPSGTRFDYVFMPDRMWSSGKFEFHAPRP